MTTRTPYHFGKIIFLILGILALFLAIGYLAGGCSSDKDKAKETEEDAGLPADYGEKALLDTTTTVVEKPAEKPAQPKEKPAQKPVVKEEQKSRIEAPPPQPQVVRTTILPANTALQISLLTQVSTGENKVGEKVRALIKGPAEQGETLNLPDGSMLEGVVAQIDDGKAEGAKAYIKLKFTSLLLPNENPIPMEGYIATKDGSGIIHPGEQGTSIARDAGIGAVAGGILGGVTGGKTKDAVKGAAAGAVAGGVLGAVLHKDQVTLKEGREFDVIIAAPVVQEKTK